MKRNIFKSTLVSALAATLLLTGCASEGEKKQASAHKKVSLEGVSDKFTSGDP